MKPQNITSIHAVDKDKVLQLIAASIEAYNAFDRKNPRVCQVDKITPPAGFEYVDYWTGYDSLDGEEKHEEVYGVVFRSQAVPEHYLFAFRGTAGEYDVVDDLGIEKKPFVAHSGMAPSGVEVEGGFFDVYHLGQAGRPSMQQQVFQLIDKYGIQQLSITGHSLGSALSVLFTMDVALSRPDVHAAMINFACPRVGNEAFVELYEAQPAQQDVTTRSLRVVNTMDKVPCVPPESIGYRHASPAYFIAFYEDGGFEERHFDWLARHKSDNYQAVLQAAAESTDGVCLAKGLIVAASGDKVDSTAPNPHYHYELL